MNNHHQNHPNWANDLPTELWEIIKLHIKSRIDVFRFRAVCKSWRSLLPLSHLQPSTTPLRLPPPPPSVAVDANIINALLFPATICRLEIASNSQQKQGAYLTKVEEPSQGQLQLLIPLSSRHLDITQGNNKSLKTLNMLDFRLVEIAKSYSLKLCNTGSPLEGIAKVLLLNHTTTTTNNSNNSDSSSFSRLGIWCLFRNGQLGYWKYGDKKWTRKQNALLYDDISVYKGQYYAVDKSGIVWWINTNSLGDQKKTKTLEVVQYSPQLYLMGDKKNLVESESMLYMVDRYIDDERVYDIRVYRLDEEWGTWFHVSSLGDRLFVLGNDCCFSASANDLAGCCTVMYRNSVFYTDSCDERAGIKGEISGYYTRVFRLDDRRIWRVASSWDHICVFSPPLEWLSSLDDQ